MTGGFRHPVGLFWAGGLNRQSSCETPPPLLIPSQMPTPLNERPANGFFRSLIRWFDADHIPEGVEALQNSPKRVDWLRSIPFIILHLICFAVIWVGVSPIAVWTAVGLYFFRMFAITGFLHRYFSHKT